MEGYHLFFFVRRDEIWGLTRFLQLLIGVTRSSSLRIDLIYPTDLNGFLCILPSTHPSQIDNIPLFGNFTPVTSSNNSSSVFDFSLFLLFALNTETIDIIVPLMAWNTSS